MGSGTDPCDAKYRYQFALTSRIELVLPWDGNWLACTQPRLGET